MAAQQLHRQNKKLHSDLIHLLWQQFHFFELTPESTPVRERVLPAIHWLLRYLTLLLLLLLVDPTEHTSLAHQMCVLHAVVDFAGGRR